MKFDPENLVNSMKKLMGEMESETGIFDGDSDSDSETDSGEDDPIMMDYMQRLDREVLEEGMKFDPENLVNSMKKLMGEMESETGMFDGESGSGEDDPIMMDYMQRLDREVLDKNNDSKDMPDLDKPLDVDASVLSNLLA